MRKRSVVLSALAVLFVVGCRRTEFPPLPSGPDVLQGILEPAELSLSRRGTHLFMQGGKTLAFAESTTVNLREFEGKLTEFHGRWEANIHPEDLPVFVVDDAAFLRKETPEMWVIPRIGITLSVPRNWVGNISREPASLQAIFTLSGALNPILTITRARENFPPANVSTDALVPVVIGYKRAVNMRDEQTGIETVFIRIGSDEGGAISGTGTHLPADILTLRFTPPEADRSELRAVFLSMLQSLRFSSEGESPSSSTSSPQGPAPSKETGKPCGGAAGILCGSGAYCEITDLQENIGICKTTRPKG